MTTYLKSTPIAASIMH